MNVRQRALRAKRDRRGFTLIELMIVAAIIGILAAIAVPIFRSAVLKAEAAKILSDYEAIRVAAAHLAGDGIQYPGSQPWRQVPSELVPYLPDNFAFDYENRRAEYRWRTWPPRNRNRPTVGLQIRARRDPDLMAALWNVYGGAGFGSQTNMILIIE